MNGSSAIGVLATITLGGLTSILIDSGEVSAHTPHDPILEVVLSPGYAEDGTGFLIVNDQLRRSTDRFESTAAITNGLVTGEPTAVAIAPSETDVVYLASTTGEVYRSDDGGRSFPLRSLAFDAVGVARLAVAPDQTDIVVAAGPFGALARSDDGAESWQPIDDLGLVTELSASSGSPESFYVGNEDGEIFVSNDGGADWEQSEAAETTSISAIADVPGDPAQVVVGDRSGGLQRSSNGGVDFDPIDTSGLPESPIHDLAIHGGSGQDFVIWATTDDGAYRSDDSGLTFELASDGLAVDQEAEVLGLLGFPSIATADDEDGEVEVVLAGFDGLFVLDADEERWRAAETLADQIVGLDVSPDFLNDRTIAVTTYVKGAYISSDGGREFVAASAGLDQAVGRSNTTLPLRRLQNVAFSPDFVNDRRIFSSTVTNMLVSDDAGASWTAVVVAPPAPEGPSTGDLVIGTGRTVVGTAVIVGSRQGTIHRSDEGGREGSWVMTADLGSPIRSVVLSPDFARLPEVFVSTSEGVVRSADGGTSFVPLDSGIRNAVLAISPDFALDRTVFAGSRSGLAVSRDGGDSWESLAVVFAPTTIEGIALSPNFGDDGTVLVSVRGVGLHRSADGGATFAPVGASLLEENLGVAAPAPSPTSNPIRFATPDTVFAFADDTVVVSTDAGLTWSESTVPPFRAFTPPPPTDDAAPEEPATPGTQPDAGAVDSPPGTAPSNIPSGHDGRRNRLIWAATGAGIVVSLGLVVATSRRRR